MKNEFSNKNLALINSGRDLFWKFGFKRVNVEDICRQAKVSKMTFYRYYQNKSELAKQIIDISVSDNLSKFKELMERDMDPEEKIRQFVMMKLDNTKQISNEFIEDLYLHKDSELKDYMSLKTNESWIEIINIMKKAQNDGWLRKNFKPEFLFAVASKVTDLFNDPYLIKLYNSHADLIMEFTNLLTYGIAPRNEKDC